MRTPERGEVWLADLGAVAKIRPVLVISVPFGDNDHALFQIVPHTTQRRGSQFEAAVPLNFLEAGIFNVQGLAAVSKTPFLKFLGTLSPSQMITVEAALKKWLGLIDRK